jgi:hypothetical protein
MAESRSIGREEWTKLCDEWRGGAAEIDRVEFRPNGLDVEAGDGRSLVTVYPHEFATDIRIGVLQLLATRDNAILLQGRGPFPRRQWDILWEGRLNGR